MAIGLKSWAGHYFFVLVRLHLVLSIFPIPVCTAQLIGDFWTNRQSATSKVAPTALALFGNVITLHPALKGKAQRICSANQKFSWVFFFAALRLLVEYESQRQ